MNEPTVGSEPQTPTTETATTPVAEDAAQAPPPVGNAAPKLIAAVSGQTAIERSMAARIMKLDPGIGDKSVAIAQALADSGLSAAASAMVIKAVYSPNDEQGRGQGTRMLHYAAALTRRYGNRMDKVRHNPAHFKMFLADMEDAIEMRDILNGEGYTISFEGAFLLWELGLDADSVLSMIQDLCADCKYPSMAIKLVIKAAQCVKSGYFMELETAIASMRYGYQYDPTDNLRS